LGTPAFRIPKFERVNILNYRKSFRETIIIMIYECFIANIEKEKWL
jgi:hypothetical protein